MKNTKAIYLFFISLSMIAAIFGWKGSELYRIKTGKIYFKSEAPLETIEAQTNRLIGLINPVSNEFAFSIQINSFEGFNNHLQRDHFNENYMESNKYAKATFVGRIIESIDFKKEGTYTVRAKGKLSIHGVTQERIIKSKLIIADDQLIVDAGFFVILKEHDIKIPKIVTQKIAKEIWVQVNAVFEPQ